MSLKLIHPNQFMLMKSFTSKELLPSFIDINDTRILSTLDTHGGI